LDRGSNLHIKTDKKNLIGLILYLSLRRLVLCDKISSRMPIIKSAQKKMRQDKKRTARNLMVKNSIKSLVKNMRRTPNAKALQEVSSVLDKAVKINLIHANKSARLKSRLSHLIVSTKSTKTASKKPAAA
jgi:small subunit ribosomal protein S20